MIVKIKDGTTKPFESGDEVLYIPKYLLMGDKSKMVQESNLGVVSSKNNTYVFVKYDGNEIAQATKPIDLYFLHGRPDLDKALEARK